MITVHHLRHSRSQRIPWLLEELGVDYTMVDHVRIGALAPPTLEAVHPLGKAPVIVDDGRVMAESGAIIDYLVDRYGNGRLGPPADEAGKRAWTYWMHYAEGSLMPLVVLGMIFARMARAPWLLRPLVRAVLKPVRQGYLDPNVERHLAWVETALGEHVWFAGADFTAADIQMSVPLLALVRPHGEDASGRWPNIRAYLSRLGEREAYRRASGRIRDCESP